MSYSLPLQYRKKVDSCDWEHSHVFDKKLQPIDLTMILFTGLSDKKPSRLSVPLLRCVTLFL